MIITKPIITNSRL